MRMRYIWKYSASQGVPGTPSLAVNGVMIQNPPVDADSMMQLLNDVYKSQKVSLAEPAVTFLA